MDAKTSLHNSSLDGINVRASGFDEPLHAENSKLDPYHFGDTKVKVEISLDFPSPSSMIVRDSQGFSVRINAKYPRSLPQCSNCGKFGHLLPKPLQKKAFHREGNMSGSFLHSRSKAKEVLVTEDLNAEASCSQQQGPQLEDVPPPLCTPEASRVLALHCLLLEWCLHASS
ncbi:unnamed protein product [Eruca vesicaria subsp. sativa]|uniref:Zinc knuckle CX2CX4HX4C domain-containing protein n=1 Tax=Eruca vesicaria subsp. sativa TaxID=29727 RepID=A0ABC8JM36_ERUVS|nr:unnamed protein product [Eruca vesicaria subsp. sativa]